MGYPNLSACIADLERNNHLIRIKEEVKEKDAKWMY